MLVDRLVPCHYCADEALVIEIKKFLILAKIYLNLHKIFIYRNSSQNDNNSYKPNIYLFTIEECILQAREYNSKNITNSFYLNKYFSTSQMLNFSIICPNHLNKQILLELMAPDVSFIDLSTDQIIAPENIKRGKLVGRGAFGFVFNGFVKQKVFLKLFY